MVPDGEQLFGWGTGNPPNSPEPGVQILGLGEGSGGIGYPALTGLLLFFQQQALIGLQESPFHWPLGNSQGQ